MSHKWQEAVRKIELCSVPPKVCHPNDFNYILKRPTFAPICFGTKQERVCLPLTGKGLTSFMKRFTPPYYPDLAPNKYDTPTKTAFCESHKKLGRKGTLPLGERFKEESILNLPPPSSKYYTGPIPKRIKRNKVPFGTSAVKRPKITNRTPGPGTYAVDYKFRTLPFKYAFNNKPRKLLTPIPVECTTVNLRKCEMCRLTPSIDYWQRNNTDIICLQCYSEEWDEHNKYTKDDLKKYSLIRNCSFKHEHNGTDTFVTTLEPKYLKKKLLLETYLSQYFTEFLPQPCLYSQKSEDPKIVNFKDTFNFYCQFTKHLQEIKKRKLEHKSSKIKNLL